MRKPSRKATELSDFLEEGLALLGYSCEPFEINRL